MAPIAFAWRRANLLWPSQGKCMPAILPRPGKPCDFQRTHGTTQGSARNSCSQEPCGPSCHFISTCYPGCPCNAITRRALKKQIALKGTHDHSATYTATHLSAWGNAAEAASTCFRIYSRDLMSAWNKNIIQVQNHSLLRMVSTLGCFCGIWDKASWHHSQ